MNKNEVKNKLLQLDEEVELLLDNPAIHPFVILVGGAAFILHDLTVRETTVDIDVLAAEDSIRAAMEHYPDINSRVTAFSDQIPYNFEDRLVAVDIGQTCINFVTPSTEDLVVMKLYAARRSDLQDIDSAAKEGKIDWQLLENLVYGENEAKASCLVERRYKEMVAEYEDFKKRCGR